MTQDHGELGSNPTPVMKALRGWGVRTPGALPRPSREVAGRRGGRERREREQEEKGEISKEGVRRDKRGFPSWVLQDSDSNGIFQMQNQLCSLLPEAQAFLSICISLSNSAKGFL